MNTEKGGNCERTLASAGLTVQMRMFLALVPENLLEASIFHAGFANFTRSHLRDSHQNFTNRDKNELSIKISRFSALNPRLETLVRQWHM
jgi:hypothetical protein